MQRLFSSLSDLERFTNQLQALPKSGACHHCHQNSHWVSHGYVYKQHSIETKMIIGKRIVCCRRFGRQGCGHTRQLYLDTVIPHRHYLAKVVFAFIATLIQGKSVQHAYLYAIQREHREARHAWRWIKDLMRRLPALRLFVGREQEQSLGDSYHRSDRLNILLPTLHILIKTPYLLSHYQCSVL